MQFRQMVLLAIHFSVVALLSGCFANPYAQYYSPAPNVPDFTDKAAQVEARYGSDPTSDALSLYEDGFRPIGESVFYGPDSGLSLAKSQARKIGAAKVVVYKRFRDTVTTSVPMTTPTHSTTYSYGSATAIGPYGSTSVYGSGTSHTYGTQTQYVPMAIDRFDHHAIYWRRFDADGIGVVCFENTIADDNGLRIDAVVKGSAAYQAGLRSGDIVVRADGKAIKSVRELQSILAKIPASQRDIVLEVSPGDQISVSLE